MLKIVLGDYRSMEIFANFLQRINSFEVKDLNFSQIGIKNNDSLKDKVSENDMFNPFFGDTIVFDLDESTKKNVATIIEVLYEKCSSIFAEKLNSQTLHITLHDLSNSPNLSEISDECFKNEIKLIEELDSERLYEGTIHMKTNCIFNMMDTSLVLGVIPSTEDDFLRLQSLYTKFDRIKSLDSSFTPHITLAYFSRGFKNFAASEIEELYTIVSKYNSQCFEFDITTKNLIYQKFTSMNKYFNIFNLLSYGSVFDTTKL